VADTGEPVDALSHVEAVVLPLPRPPQLGKAPGRLAGAEDTRKPFSLEVLSKGLKGAKVNKEREHQVVRGRPGAFDPGPF
jgi:hypothetical protein